MTPVSTGLPLDQDFLSGFPEPLIVTDRDWRIQFANADVARIAGKEAHELIGANPWDFWPAPVRERIALDHQTALSGGAAVLIEGVSADMPLELRAFACDLGIIAYYRASSEYASASALKARLAAIVESSDDAIISKDLNGIIRSWNAGAQRILGYTADEAIGHHISMIAPPDRKDEMANILKRIAVGERVEHFQTKRQAKDGRILTVSLTVSPVRDATGVIIGASKVARDITESERQAEALREANEALTRSNADLQQFAYSASHDLQEPLRMVSAYGDMLKRKFGGKLGPAGEEYIGYIIDGASRMEQLLQDLRAYTQSSTMPDQPPQEVDALDVLKRALANLEASIQDSGAIITHSNLPRVHIQEVQLQQLFQNLIGNAIRYRSLEVPRIHVAAESNGTEWQFSVQDNGIGIPPRYREVIFGVFKRLHSVSEYPGTGMGLAICQRIVQRARGRIWVESEVGRGSTFFFTLPA
jgi:PAS domain S-box-containing protein